MKEMIKRWSSFITFDLPLETDHIRAAFSATHAQQQKEILQWSTNATRQKMIAGYWSTDVFRHFLLLLIFPILIVCLIYREFSPASLLAIAAAIMISFSVLLLFNYWPYFSGSFLPKLETVKEIYERRQQEQVEKCRRFQLSNLALVLVFYVFDKTSGINSLKSSDQYASCMTKLYGVDRGSLKGNLELIIVGSSQRKNWTERKRTEVENRFGEAYQFFEELGFPAGVQILKDLEAKTVMK
jgi:hypothetical protein